MRKSIATVSLSGTLIEKLEAIAAAGFDGVEIFENDLLFYNGPVRDVRRYAADLGLSIDLFQPFRDFEGVSDEQHKRNLARAERKFDLMGELGAPLMLVCSNVGTDVSDDDARAAAQLYELAEHAARHQLKIGYEALSWGTRVRTFDHAWRIVETANHPHLGLILDSFHTLALPDDWSSLAGLPGQRIFFVQLADAPRLGMTPLTLSRHFRSFPGQGDFDVPGFLRAVLATGYAGTISLEIFSDETRSALPRLTAEDAFRSLRFLEEQVRSEPARQGSTSGMMRRRVELFDPPPPPVIRGIRFVEFAVDQRNEEPFAVLLGQLGFRRLGRHRSKEVSLFGQGDIRIVVNREPDSFAESYFLMHGPSVCALALETNDALAALGRAEAYGAARFDGRIGPNELAIPAIRSDAGSLIYFSDHEIAANFETDFEVEPEAASRSPLLTRIDHIAEALPDGRLDSTVLFYRAVLGLEPEASVVLADPYGLVRSKAVSNCERTLRMPLNISESRNTVTARSVSNYAGAGVHHIALATDDILAAADTLKMRGAEILRIPVNYYDDIQARFGLDDKRLDALRDANILYDRDGDGEFLHFYTMPFQDRFYFEIVQRLGGYDSYGAPNAPVRMAALAATRMSARDLAEL
ncbi:sugar phosphate isomerase/epimerase and 4-hydroxyphenylpyruvate domain-containing protein [Mesorhizobium sp.]|uniref:bifunctional sugar phosphate isomerase/epimerase/4-hydroxyphenylpyruvate dioxygenase family protein n=2 Tax=unclassified Mesorhizobium TaxID=325217 RepID=UPI000FE3F551|nr:sugar phosphate isomerase/epimerase and 4-hydroxyphenylpyruvate domain-containing protein [Mesorhizobium sp.]RWG90707.1 MAG: sugar phosphate isomerase/epimerase and 4-hydroxyphenylpyruvate domain-containing protein [Mesorhizobium sp.]RWK21348.1 MAG: sugar phosphate isomerase/epimerase and 4-hydroxyphenylpyruvate domain-containing protein [Mesorhizobium sp.]TIQ46446.1 MAG: sugar phosphate isomerase/epimerase and 4-hydroxyphenylpyruvate domain-containing protein [Mesorhizobium sp.]